MSKRSTIDTGTERANTVSGLRSATRGRSTPRAATRARVDKSITKAAMQALQAENAVLRGRIDELEARLFSDVDASASPYPYVYLDAVGRILNLNSTAAAVLGAERSRIIGQPFSSFVAEESRNQFFLHLHACRKSAEATTRLMLQPHNGGTLRHIELISAADAQGTGPVLAHAVILDADRRREAEEGNAGRTMLSRERCATSRRSNISSRPRTSGCAQHRACWKNRATAMRCSMSSRRSVI